jgi:uncharacterized phage-associated protein
MTTTTKSVELAKYIITCAKKNNIDIDSIKLHKLLYICDGYFSTSDIDLIGESPYAWNFGPVYPSVKTWLADNRDAFDSHQECSADVINEIKEYEAEELINAVVSEYGKESASSLSLWTHQPGSPWEQAINSYGGLSAPMSRKEMKKFFQSLIENRSRY